MTINGKEIAENVIDGVITASAFTIATQVFMTDAPVKDQPVALIICICIGLGFAAWKAARQWVALK